MGSIISVIVVAIVLIGITLFLYKRRANEKSDTWITRDNSFDKLVSIVLKDATEITKIDRGLVYKDVEYEASRRNKERIQMAFKRCVYGEENARQVTIATFREIIAKHLLTLEQCNKIMDFSDLDRILTPEEKFEIMIYEVSKEHHKNALKYLNDKYDFTREREVIKNGNRYFRRELDYKLIDEMFKEEVMKYDPETEEIKGYNALTYEQSLDMISLFVYQKAKGFGKVDTLRTLNIDGLELGTSGSIRYKILNTKPDYKIEESCWIQLDAKWVHLSFINLETQDELKRLVNNMSNVEGSEALTVKKPLKVVDGYNGDRITAIREGVGATYGIFIRSFSAGIISVEKWLDKPEVKNWKIADRLIYYLAQAEQNAAYTGQQNTGKTTLMKGAIGYYPQINIRVLEMSFELNLNEVYPDRNVFCTKPTASATNTEIQSQLKKTDGYLSMVGEIATDDVAANAMQFGQVGSSSTIFSHHGKDYKGLIDGLMGSLLTTGIYSNEEAAKSVVLDVVKHNIHLNFHGKLRVVEYIEEIVKGDRVVPYPATKKSNNLVEAIDQMTEINKVFYERTTDRMTYDHRQIIVFNKHTNTYEPKEWYTAERFADILNKMPEHLVDEFLDFFWENWGNRLAEEAGVAC